MKKQRKSLKKYSLLGGILILSAALRVYSLGKASYWIDEMVSVHFATRPYFNSIFWDNNPFLYHLILKGWVKIFGEWESATRFLSVIFSVSTTAILFFLGDMVAGLGGACLMALLQCFYPLSINYAQETRMYALFEMATALHLYYLYRFAVLGKKSLGYVFSIPLLCLTQYLAAIPLLLEAVWFATQRRQQKNRKWILIGGALGLLVLAGSYEHFFSWKFLEWQKFKYNAEPESRWPGRILWVWGQQNLATAAGTVILFIFSIYNMLRDPVRYKKHFFFLFFPLGALAVMWVDALVASRGVFLPRYFIFTVPFLVAWMTVAYLDLFHVWRRAAVGCLVLIFGGTVMALPNVYVSSKSPWRDAGKFVTSIPSSTAFSTRTAAVETPYFETGGVTVKKWDPGSEGLPPLLEALEHYQNVWILENLYGGIQYFDKLEKRLKDEGLETSEMEFKTDTSEPILVMRIQKKN